MITRCLVFMGFAKKDYKGFLSHLKIRAAAFSVLFVRLRLSGSGSGSFGATLDQDSGADFRRVRRRREVSDLPLLVVDRLDHHEAVPVDLEL